MLRSLGILKIGEIEIKEQFSLFKNICLFKLCMRSNSQCIVKRLQYLKYIYNVFINFIIYYMTKYFCCNNSSE